MSISLIFGNKITLCEDSIGHTFDNKMLCAEALNAGGDTSSFYGAARGMPTLMKNDRLAVMGDAVALKVLCLKWYHSQQDKGTWTQMRNDALSNDTLASKGFLKGLDICVRPNHGTVAVSKKMMATAVEAILGAVHLDGGDEALEKVMRNLSLLVPPMVRFARP